LFPKDTLDGDLTVLFINFYPFKIYGTYDAIYSELAEPLQECRWSEGSYFFRMNITANTKDNIISLSHFA
jgi:hypothetical protein